MALAATTVWDVRTTGSDSINSGAFDPGQTAGMFTDGAATSATGSSPVFSSTSYNFVAGDVDAWLFIASGTNWTPGWYKIASVAANAATLSAAIGAATLSISSSPRSPNTSVGCATTASPTGATWSIDYSQQAAAEFAYTDLASAGAGLTVSSAALPFAKQQVGNSLVITGGTNFTTGRYVIASVAAGVATVVGAGNITSGAGASGIGGQGGALATPAQAINTSMVVGNQVHLKNGSFTTGAALALLGNSGRPSVLSGYNLTRGDLDAVNDFANFPTIQTTTSVTSIVRPNNYTRTRNIILDMNAKATTYGWASSAHYNTIENCKVIGLAGTGGYAAIYDGSQRNIIRRCYVVLATTNAAAIGIEADGGSVVEACVVSLTGSGGTGFYSAASNSKFLQCIAYGCLGANGHGFLHASTFGGQYRQCISYNNAQNGFYSSGGNSLDIGSLYNCIAALNGAYGISSSVAWTDVLMDYNAFYSNTSGSYNNVPAGVNDQVLSGNPFTNAAGLDFSLNSTAGAGALCRALGFPGVFPGGTTTGYLDIGAVQHADPVSGPVGHQCQ